jgi:hypothetical protein
MVPKQRTNPHLASASYALTAFDPEQSDSFPYPVRRGEFRFDLWTLPHLVVGDSTRGKDCDLAASSHHAGVPARGWPEWPGGERERGGR